MILKTTQTAKKMIETLGKGDDITLNIQHYGKSKTLMKVKIIEITSDKQIEKCKGCGIILRTDGDKHVFRKQLFCEDCFIRARDRYRQEADAKAKKTKHTPFWRD